MARTIILGGKNTEDLAIQLEAELIEVPDLYASDLGAINDFVVCRLKQNLDVLVIDVDNIQRPDVALALGLYLRLSFAELGANSLVPIIIASDKRIKSFLHFADYSQLLLTENVYFQPRTEIVTDAVSPLDANKYKTNFLDFINVNSGPEIGRHSLANQWGASVLYRMVSSDVIPQNESLTKAQKSLYFKYVFAKTTVSIDQYINSTEDNNTHKAPTSKINAIGKKILLIDDEADKGWAEVLDAMFIGKNRFDVIRERVPDYNSLSEDARNKIEFGDYDLIFLDLRMNGIAEENNLEPEKFSGMDILRKIKSLNKGTQVIILTASNKAWNLKALLDVGADGYYTKESPELLFPYEVSYGNYVALQKTVNQCFERGYLRRVYPKIEQLKKLVKQYNFFGDKTDVILGNIDVAFDLLAKNNRTIGYNAYSFLQLYIVIEEFVNQDSVIDITENDLYLCNINNRYRLLKDKKKIGGGKMYEYNSVLSFKSHFVLKKDKYQTTRFIDTNFRISALLIFKFGKPTSSVSGWTDIYNNRNTKAAHPQKGEITVSDIHQILDFMLFFFNENNASWRDIKDAFPEESMEEQMKKLQEKFSSGNSKKN